MEFSDSDYECVVAKIFDGVDLNNKEIPAQKVMMLIAPYIGSDRSEFLLLKDLLDPYSINKKIDRDALKTALLQWTHNLKNEKDSCIIEDLSIISNYDMPDQIQYTSFCSGTSDGYRERITELQNEVAERDHHMRMLKRQLDHAAALTQQHEDALTVLVSEREQLISKLLVEQSNNAATSALKLEYNELIDSLNILREKSSDLRVNLDILKKENIVLNGTITDLENEKHSLTQLLSQSNEDKNKALKLLSVAQMDIEVLRSECFQFNERVHEQEKTIQHLTSVKYSLEIDLQNTVNKSAHYMRQIDDSFEEKNNCNSNDSNNEKVEQQGYDSDVSPVDVTKFGGGENVFNDNYITSTPRNSVSLMQELIATPSPSAHSNTTNYDHFKLSLGKIQFQNCLTYNDDNDDGTPTFAEESFCTTLPKHSRNTIQLGDDILNNKQTYILGSKNVSNSRSESEDYENKLTLLERELKVHKNINSSLVLKLNANHSEILKLQNVIKCQGNRMVEMMNHQSLLSLQTHCADRSMKEAAVRMKVIQLLNERRTSWLRRRLHNPRELLDNQTQTDLELLELEMERRKTLLQQNKSNMLHNVLFWGTLVCFSLAYLHLFNTMKYCNAIRNGSDVHFYPWQWMSLNEFVLSVFDFKYTGPVPI